MWGTRKRRGEGEKIQWPEKQETYGRTKGIKKKTTGREVNLGCGKKIPDTRFENDQANPPRRSKSPARRSTERDLKKRQEIHKFLGT